MEFIKALGAIFGIVGSIFFLVWFGGFIWRVYQNKRTIDAILNHLGFEVDGPITILKPKDKQSVLGG